MNDQLEELLQFLGQHPALAKRVGLGARSKETVDKEWNNLATKLNAHGSGSSKSGERWKKVWADWKSKIKKKASLIRRHASGTGGGPSIRQTLTAFEERVLAIMGNLTVDGLPSIQEQGFRLLQVISSPTLALSPPPAMHQQDTIDREITTANQSVAISPPAPTTPTPSCSWQPPHTLTQETSTSQDQSMRSSRVQPAPSTPPPTCRRRFPPTPRSGITASSTQTSLRARRRLTLTPFDRATSEFVTIEHLRLRQEETRDRQLYELETRRIEVDHERNQVLRMFADIAQAWFDHYRSKDNTDNYDSTQDSVIIISLYSP
ncbi:unnamed protein product [Parnassius mnemosyne]|uniref:Regulatory protein zeste n=1 Tax=Parnassius mnemosyne TaxID=213953 RepID=A0AAV1LB66_9NEOP